MAQAKPNAPAPVGQAQTDISAQDDVASFLEQVKRIVDDPSVEVRYNNAATRPAPAMARLDSELFRTVETAVTKIYNAPTLPTMSTGATDMAYLRSKGIQCYGVGPATDFEDGPKGFGAHSDQERILESELYRFVRFHYDIVADLARKK